MFIGFTIGMRNPQGLTVYQQVANLYTSGQQGAWYDYSNLTQEYQDNIGTTPVTAVEQPLGLVLDGKNQYTLGAELAQPLTAVNWSASGADATHIATFSGNTLRYQSDTTSPQLSVGCNALAGAIPAGTYEVTVVVSNYVSGAVKVFENAGANGFLTVNGLGTFKAKITVTTTSGLSITCTTPNVDLTLSSVSLKLVSGNHLTQATAGARPVLSGRVNLQLKSEKYGDSIGWASNTGNTYTQDAMVSEGVSLTLVVPTVTSGTKTPYSIQGSPAGAKVLTFLCKPAGYRYIQIYDAGLATWGFCVFDSQTGTFTQNSLAWPTTATLRSDGTYRVTVSIDTGTSSSYGIGPTNAATAASPYGSVFAGDGVSGLYLGGVQMESGTIATTYQRVNTATDYNTAGFPTYAKFDGVDDSLTSATGGGATSGFFFCAAVKPLGGAGVERHIWSNQNGNNGYVVVIDSTNQLRFYAGNGTTFTSVSTASTTNIGTTYLFTAWDDGSNLNVQIDNGSVASSARPTVAAGTTSFTVGKHNTAVSNYFNGNIYPSICRTGTPLTATERAAAQAWCKSKAGL